MNRVNSNIGYKDPVKGKHWISCGSPKKSKFGVLVEFFCLSNFIDQIFEFYFFLKIKNFLIHKLFK